MAFTYHELRTKSEDDLIAIHDQMTTHVVLSVDYLLDELRRRDQQRAIAASHRLAVASFVLTIVNATLAVAAVIVAVLA